MSSGKSQSSSSTTTQTTTQQYDQRVGAEGGAVALGQGASLSINEQFPENVAKAFNELINLARDAGELIINSNQNLQEVTKNALASNEKTVQMALQEVTKNALASNEKTVQMALEKVNAQGRISADVSKNTTEALAKLLETQGKGASTIFTDLFPYIAAGIIGLVAIVIYLNTKKR
jgi:hypothetical protein